MEINELQHIYAAHPNSGALAAQLQDKAVKTLFLSGLHASAAPLFFSAYLQKAEQTTVFILNDLEEAGYFYHDILQLVGEEQALFLPSSYKRAVKYGQRDAANEILRTDVISRLSSYVATAPLFVVTFPAALAERVASGETLKENTLDISEGKEYDLTDLTQRLKELGFHRRDYVYEPGEYAVRGSILDIFSFSGELPYRSSGNSDLRQHQVV
jgi:transcription-repair coupling factor (superfamily II helicase)